MLAGRKNDSRDDPLSIIRKRAAGMNKRVVFPEGEETRTIQAVKRILDEGIAEVLLIGDKSRIRGIAKEHSVNLDSAKVIDPQTSAEFDTFVDDYVKIRQHKQTTDNDARQTIADPLYFGAMLVRHGLADASVAGAINTTADVIRSSVQVIGLKKGIEAVSSCFLMVIPEFLGVKGKAFLYADCGVIPNPDASQLASIAVSTADTMRCLLAIEPRVALLSFSTKGSANHSEVEKVREALEILKREHPELKADGELQVDAAIIPEVAAQKVPQSEVAGKANILIFPDLDAGNIAYKLTERLAGATAIGPILQGLAKPVNDLSRGCSAEDIVNAAAIACVMT